MPAEHQRQWAARYSSFIHLLIFCFDMGDLATNSLTVNISLKLSWKISLKFY